VHQLVNKNFESIKMHGTIVKRKKRMITCFSWFKLQWYILLMQQTGQMFSFQYWMLHSSWIVFLLRIYMQYFKATHIRPPAAGFIPLYFVKYSAYQGLYLVPAEFEILIMTQLYVIHQVLVRRSAFENNYFFSIWTPPKDVFLPGRYDSICAGP
jgi:hypothetical protein